MWGEKIEQKSKGGDGISMDIVWTPIVLLPIHSLRIFGGDSIYILRCKITINTQVVLQTMV